MNFNLPVTEISFKRERDTSQKGIFKDIHELQIGDRKIFIEEIMTKDLKPIKISVYMGMTKKECVDDWGSSIGYITTDWGYTVIIAYTERTTPDNSYDIFGREFSIKNWILNPPLVRPDLDKVTFKKWMKFVKPYVINALMFLKNNPPKIREYKNLKDETKNVFGGMLNEL